MPSTAPKPVTPSRVDSGSTAKTKQYPGGHPGRPQHQSKIIRELCQRRSRQQTSFPQVVERTPGAGPADERNRGEESASRKPVAVRPPPSLTRRDPGEARERQHTDVRMQNRMPLKLPRPSLRSRQCLSRTGVREPRAARRQRAGVMKLIGELGQSGPVSSEASVTKLGHCTDLRAVDVRWHRKPAPRGAPCTPSKLRN